MHYVTDKLSDVLWNKVVLPVAVRVSLTALKYIGCLFSFWPKLTMRIKLYHNDSVGLESH